MLTNIALYYYYNENFVLFFTFSDDDGNEYRYSILK